MISLDEEHDARRLDQLEEDVAQLQVDADKVKLDAPQFLVAMLVISLAMISFFAALGFSVGLAWRIYYWVLGT